jgi:teichuronic acid exporter
VRVTSNVARSVIAWSGTSVILQNAIAFGIQIVLARLLAPEHFGAVALLALFVGVANLFVSAGFSAALIQDQNTTRLDESTVFWFTVAAGIAMSVGMCAIAPLIASFYGMPVLRPLTLAMAATVFVSSLGAVHNTMLTKRLEFRRLTLVGVVATLISGGIGVALAWNGLGVWALVAQAVSNAVVGTTLAWIACSWRPMLAFSRGSFERLFGFGGYMFASALMDTVFQQGYTVLIGRLFGLGDVGLYDRAQRTQQLPTKALNSILERSAFPLFAALNGDDERLRRATRLSIRSTMLATAPLMVGGAVVAEPLVVSVFGEAWRASAPIFRVLCIVGLLYPIHVVNLSVLRAQGHGRTFFRLEIIKKAIGITLLIAGSFLGVIGIAWSRVVQSVVALAINAHYTRRNLGYGLLDQLRDCVPSLLMSLFMAATVIVADHRLGLSGILEFVVLVGLGGAVYIGGTAALGLGAYREATDFFFPRSR